MARASGTGTATSTSTGTRTRPGTSTSTGTNTSTGTGREEGGHLGGLERLEPVDHAVERLDRHDLLGSLRPQQRVEGLQPQVRVRQHVRADLRMR